MASVCTWDIPADMYSPIKQKMVVLNKAKDKLAAQAFYSIYTVCTGEEDN